jgi:Leucine-rich repeat (LRR) protein
VQKGGQRFVVKTLSDIPPGKFDIVEINFDRLNSTLPPPNAEDFNALKGLRDLRRIFIRIPNSGLADSAWAWISGNDSLEYMNFESAGEVTGRVLDYLASAKKLNQLNVEYSKSFTGEGLDKMPFAPAVQVLDFLATAFTDEGLQALAGFKQVRDLRITQSGTATDRGFTTLGALKNLDTLSLIETAFGDEAAAAIAQLPKLASLNLEKTQLTDAGLEKLRTLKNLKSLVLRGSKVSADAVAAFQKAVPQCKVTQ